MAEANGFLVFAFLLAGVVDDEGEDGDAEEGNEDDGSGVDGVVVAW